MVSTLAGSGFDGAQDGLGSAARFRGLSGITIDAAGNLYVADSHNNRIRKVTPAGMVSTVAGILSSAPSGIVTDAKGNLYVAGGFSISKVTPAGEISILAGDKGRGFADGPGRLARFSFPSGITIDAAGNLYVADKENHRIRKVTPAGVVSTFAGSGQEGFFDGPGNVAQFNLPSGITIDVEGNLYVADSRNNRIRKVTPAGMVSTVAGGGKTHSWHDPFDIFSSAPSGIVTDAKGNLYVAGGFNISKVTPAGEISILAGEDIASDSGSAAQFGWLFGITIDAAGNLYVTGASGISKITPKGVLSSLAGGGKTGFADGSGSAAQFDLLRGIAVDAAGNLYVVDRNNHRIRKISPAGAVSTFAGSKIGYANGPGSVARFHYPTAIAIDAAGNLYVADSYNHRIRKITPKGMVSTFAGNGPSFIGTGPSGYVEGGFANGSKSVARFDNPVGIATDTAGNLYVADSGNFRIRKISPKGVVSTLAGSAKSGHVDGVGTAARFGELHAITIDAEGNLYVMAGDVIRKVTPKGVVSTPIISVAAQNNK